MRALPKVDVRRKQMLLELGKHGLLKGDLHRALQGAGVAEGVGALRPDRFRPAQDASQTAMQKWVQAALNVVLGLRLKLDGAIGPVTRQGLRRFQREEGLQAHGYADEATLQVLELRVGLACPRGGHHEAVPSLLILPMRGVWMPKPRGQGGRERDDGAGAHRQAATAAAPAAAADVVPPGIAVREGARSPEDSPAWREALAGARALAFAPAFIERAATALAQPDDAALEQGMQRWADARLSQPEERAPAWVRTVRADARANPAAAASLLRRVWWASHVEAEDGL